MLRRKVRGNAYKEKDRGKVVENREGKTAESWSRK